MANDKTSEKTGKEKANNEKLKALEDWRDKHYAFMSNRECELFPCHVTGRTSHGGGLHGLPGSAQGLRGVQDGMACRFACLSGGFSDATGRRASVFQ